MIPKSMKKNGARKIYCGKDTSQSVLCSGCPVTRIDYYWSIISSGSQKPRGKNRGVSKQRRKTSPKRRPKAGESHPGIECSEVHFGERFVGGDQWGRGRRLGYLEEGIEKKKKEPSFFREKGTQWRGEGF